jgi:hypothetical protein
MSWVSPAADSHARFRRGLLRLGAHGVQLLHGCIRRRGQDVIEFFNRVDGRATSEIIA